MSAGFFMLLILALGCGDGKAPLYTIAGRWQASDPDQPGWVYEFRQGIMTNTITATGEVRLYLYAERADTLFLSSAEAAIQPRAFLLTWHDHNRVGLTPLTGPLYNLRELRRAEE